MDNRTTYHIPPVKTQPVVGLATPRNAWCGWDLGDPGPSQPSALPRTLSRARKTTVPTVIAGQVKHKNKRRTERRTVLNNYSRVSVVSANLFTPVFCVNNRAAWPPASNGVRGLTLARCTRLATRLLRQSVMLESEHLHELHHPKTIVKIKHVSKQLLFARGEGGVTVVFG